MPSRLQKICDAVMEATWLAAVIVVPLFFNVYSQRVFEPDKISLLRSLALIAIVAWGIKQVDGLRIREGEKVEPENGSGAGKTAWWRRPLVVPILLLAAVYLLSTLLSVVPRQSFWGSYQRLQGTFTMLSYMVFFLVILDSLRTRAQWQRLQYAIILASLPIALYGVLQKAQMDPLNWGGDTATRVTANLGNSIFLAAYLIMVVPLTIERLVAATRRMLGDAGTTTDALTAGALLFVLVVQLLAIVFTQSRGPWLGLATGLYLLVLLSLTSLRQRAADQGSLRSNEVGLGVGLGILGIVLLGMGLTGVLLLPGILSDLFLFLMILAALALYLVPLLKRNGWRWLWLSFITQGIIVFALLIAINLTALPLHSSFRQLPYIGRLAQITEVDRGTGRVRVLIWQGVIDMLGAEEPLSFPDGERDGLSKLRPLIGYGPESMWVAYNRFYKPELGNLEHRNASPDRSHNETFDSLVITGLIGFLAYTFVFVSLIYYALKWLGLILKRRDTWIFVGLALGGALLGVLIAWASGKLYLAGVGLPLGFILGVLAYITYAAARGSDTPHKLDRRQMLIVALLAAVVAHYVEIHLGIAIAATRTYFFVYAAALIAIGIGLVPVEAKPETVSADTAPSKSRKRRRTRGSRVMRPASTSSQPQLWRRLLPYALIMAIILIVLDWNFISNQAGREGLFAIFSRSWLSYLRNGVPLSGPAALLLVIFTLIVGLIVALDEVWSPQISRTEVVRALISFLAIALIAWLAYGLMQADRLAPLSADLSLEQRADRIAGHFAIFVLWLGLGLVLLAASLWWNDLRPSKRFSSHPILAPAAGLLLTIVALFIITNVNINLVKADVYFKLGQGSDARRDWSTSLVFYDQASAVAPSEDHYQLFRGRALLESARSSTDPVQQRLLLDRAEQVLLHARELNPLNTDHSANLGRYYTARASTLSDEAARAAALQSSIESYLQATKLSPHAAHLQNELASVYTQLGEYELARERFDRSLELDPNFYDTYLRLANMEVQEENWLAALDAYTRAAELRPQDPSAQSGRGYVLAQLGRLDEAVEANLKVLELRPNDLSALQNLVLLYQQMGEYQQALDTAYQVRDLLPAEQQASLDALIAQLLQEMEGS